MQVLILSKLKNIMKKYFNLLIIFTSIFLFSKCKKETVITTSNHINFENLAIGQKSYYINFKSKNPTLDSDTAFKATTDTILLKVIDKNENGFLIREEWLNTLAFHDSNQIVFDGPAISKIYTKSNGFITFQTIGGFAPYGSIFNLMP